MTLLLKKPKIGLDGQFLTLNGNIGTPRYRVKSQEVIETAV